jgi:hypothetical protein
MNNGLSKKSTRVEILNKIADILNEDNEKSDFQVYDNREIVEYDCTDYEEEPIYWYIASIVYHNNDKIKSVDIDC